MDIPAVYWIEVAGLRHPAHHVRGREALSTPWRFEVRLHLPGAPFRPADVLKRPAVLQIERGELARSVHGLVTSCRIRATARGAPLVELVLEPRLALARQGTDLRVFRDMTAVEIVCEVLDSLGVKTERWLAGTYARRPYCVQLRETHLAFVSRLLEDEGIFYYFLEGDVMVLGDRPGAYEPAPGARHVPFRPMRGMTHVSESVHEIGRRAKLVPARISLRDFNPERPRLDMEVAAAVPSPSGVEWYDYPGRYATPPEGEQKAQRMAEAQACAAGALAGASTVTQLAPGRVIGLWDSPGGSFDGDHVITSVEHAFSSEEGGFSNRFEALGADVAFRPLRATPEPRLLNPLTGFVTGPPGQDIHTDAWGRVKVHFHWDRRQPCDDRCSHWIPVAQDNTGESCGIPRVGWEVAVHFLEGDPDRPVVLGRVYNTEDEPPLALPEYKMCSALRSASSPTRTGRNEIRFDDRKGGQLIWMHAERDQSVTVTRDKEELVLDDETHFVDRDETIEIGHNLGQQVVQDQISQIGQDQSLTVGGSRSRTVGANDSAAISGNRTVVVKGKHFRRVGTDDKVAVNNLTERIGLVALEASVGQNATSVTGSAVRLTGAASAELVRKDKSETTRLARAEVVGGAFVTSAGGNIATKSGRRSTLVLGDLDAKAAQAIDIEGKKQLSLEAGSIDLAGGGSLVLKVGSTSVALKGGSVEIQAANSIRIVAGGLNRMRGGAGGGGSGGAPASGEVPAGVELAPDMPAGGGGGYGAVSGGGGGGYGAVSGGGGGGDGAVPDGGGPTDLLAMGLDDRGGAPSRTANRAPRPAWSLEEMKRIMMETPTGRRVWANLPSSTRFGIYDGEAADRAADAFYSLDHDMICMPAQQSVMAMVPTLAHEMEHADQYVNQERRDFLQMEVDAYVTGMEMQKDLLDEGYSLPDDVNPALIRKSMKMYEDNPRAFKDLVYKKYKERYTSQDKDHQIVAPTDDGLPCEPIPGAVGPRAGGR